MKKEVKYKHLNEKIEQINCLASFPMPARHTLSVYKVKKLFSSEFEVFTQTVAQIGESRCLRDKDGLPIKTFQKDHQGKELKNLPMILAFESKEIENKALSELTELMERSLEYEVSEMPFEELNRYENLSLAQLEALETVFCFK
jgi:hypothetical protein